MDPNRENLLDDKIDPPQLMVFSMLISSNFYGTIGPKNMGSQYRVAIPI